MRNKKRIIAWKLHISINQKTTSLPNVGSSVRKTETVVVSYQSLQNTVHGESVIAVSYNSQCFHFLANVRVKQTKPVVRHILQVEAERVGEGVMWCLKYHLDLWTCPWDCRQRTWNKRHPWYYSTIHLGRYSKWFVARISNRKIRVEIQVRFRDVHGPWYCQHWYEANVVI
jgi:hypothetical protein